MSLKHLSHTNRPPALVFASFITHTHTIRQPHTKITFQSIYKRLFQRNSDCWKSFNTLQGNRGIIVGRVHSQLPNWVSSDTIINPDCCPVFYQFIIYWHVVKIVTILVAISAFWIGLLETSVVPRSHTWLLPIYFIVSLGCYGLLMVGVGLMQFPTCPQEALLLQQDIVEAKEFLKGKGVDVGSD